MDRIAAGSGGAPCAPTRQARPSAAAQWVAMALFTLIGAGAVAATVEFEHYRGLLLLAHGSDEYLPAGACELIFCSLWAKSLIVAAPLLALCGFLVWAGRRRAAKTVFLLGAFVLGFWLVADVKVHSITHNHILAYAAFLRNRTAVEIGGGITTLLGPYVTIFLLTAAGVAGLALICDLLARWLVGRAGGLGPRLCPVLAAILFLAPILAVIPAQRQFRRPALQDYLYSELPVALPAVGQPAGKPSPAEAARLRVSALVQRTYQRVFDRLYKPAPLDKAARLDLPCGGARQARPGEPLGADALHPPPPPPPNVILIVLESLRYDALSPKMMPRLNAWADRGLRFERHYSAANDSEEGLFSLLYGRSPLVCDVTLDSGVMPQLCRTLQNSGYRTCHLGATPPQWMGSMEKFVNAECFNEISVKTEGSWWQRDAEVLDDLRQMLRRHPDKPHFVYVSTMSTHFPFEYPPEYELHRPVASHGTVLSGTGPEHQRRIRNRYMNAARFADDKVADLIEGLDPKRNLIILTGDHGESLLDDGSIGHCSRLSEIQTRVPMAIVGPGVKPGRLTRWTSHTDFLPTLFHILAGKAVAVAQCQGRDLLEPAQGAEGVMVCTRHALAGAWVLGVLAGPEGRVMFKATTDKPCFILLGRCDEAANLDIMNPLSEKELTHWQRIFEEEFERLAR